MIHLIENRCSAPSSAIHFGTSPRERALDSKTMEFGVAHVLLLSHAITRRATLLLEPEYSAPDEGTGEMAPRHGADVAVGDWVMVTLDRQNLFLAEVTSVNATDLGTVGYGVRFVGQQPYADLAQDEVPSTFTQPFMQREALANELRQRHPSLGELGDDEMAVALRAAVLEVWSLAMKDVCLRQLAAASDTK